MKANPGEDLFERCDGCSVADGTFCGDGTPLDAWPGAAGAVDALVVQILTHAADAATSTASAATRADAAVGPGADAGVVPALLPECLQAAVVDVLEGLPAGPDLARLLAILDPAMLAGGCLLAALRASERVASWAQAGAVGHTARFAAPGVGVPVHQLIDALTHGTGGHRVVGPNPLALRGDQARGGDGDGDGDGLDPDNTADVGEHRTPTGVEATSRPGRDDTAELLAHPVWGPALTGEAQRLAGPEVAAALTLSPITAGKRIAEAVEFTTELAATWRAWHGGLIDRSRAWTIADATSGLPADLRAAVQERVLPDAADLTPGRLRALTGRVAIEIDPAAARDRLEEAKTRRQVTLKALRDGLARLAADLPADQALLGFRLIDELADTLPSTPDDHRGIAERRADVLADLLNTLATQGHIDLRRQTADQHNEVPGTAEVPGPDPVAEQSTDLHAGDQNPAARRDPQSLGDPPAADKSADACCHLCGQTLPGSRSAASWRRRRGPVHVDVVIAASTLARLDEQPAQLVGFGAITADLARALVASATTIRGAVQHAHPDRPGHETVTGAPPPGNQADPSNARGGGTHTPAAGGCCTPLDYGRTVYRPPAALDRHIRDRDQTCRFPGCRQPAWRCDLDHRAPYATGGATCPCNLDALCRTHHRVKTFTSWTATRTPDGALRWRSPHGYTSSTPPDHHPTDSTPDTTTDEPPPF